MSSIVAPRRPELHEARGAVGEDARDAAPSASKASDVGRLANAEAREDLALARVDQRDAAVVRAGRDDAAARVGTRGT